MPDLQSQDIKRSITSFNTLNADITVHQSDIPSHYNHSPERHRLYINGSRFNLMYGSTDRFEDTPDSYLLKPDAGDVIEYTTAERFRYSVGYVLNVSGAMSANQELEGDDEVIIGYGDIDLDNGKENADGWFVEFNSSHSENEGDLVVYRGGVEKARRTLDFNQPYTSWKRYEMSVSWNDAGKADLVETYTSNTEQYNKRVGRISVDNEKSTLSGNHRFVFAVKADSSTSDLELDCGSVGVIFKGNVDPIVRAKAFPFTSSHSGSGEWEVVGAMRVDPDRPEISTQVAGLSVMEISEDADVVVMAMSFDSSNTDASDYEVPAELNGVNSVIQFTQNVSEFVDVDGDTVTSAADPGGFQLGYSSYYTEGTGTKEKSNVSRRIRKRTIYNGDVCLFLAKSSVEADITVEVETEQDW